MRRVFLALLMGMAVLAGCRQGNLTSRGVSADDLVSKYARERGLSHEEAEQCIRQEVATARAGAVSSVGGAPASLGVR